MQYQKSSQWVRLAALGLVMVMSALTLPSEVAAQENTASTPAASPSSNRAKLENKLKTIVIDKVDFNKADIGDVIQFLAKKSKELDPDKVGINFVLADLSHLPPQDHIHREVSVTLENVPIEELLKYIIEQTNLQYSVEEYAVNIRPAVDESETLTVRTYLVSAQFLEMISQARGNGSGAPTGDAQVDFKQPLTNLGIRFPVGATATYLPESSKLVVRDTPEQLDSIAKLIDQLNAPHTPPLTNSGTTPPGN